MKKTRLFCLLLSLLVLLPLISACGEDTGAPEETTPAVTSSEVTVPVEDQYRFKSANYKDRDFGVLNMTMLDEFYTADGNGTTAVDEAVFRRNSTVEEKYNVNLVFYPMVGTNSGKDAFNAEIRANETSGGGLYSLYMGQTFYTMALIVEGMYYDILQSKVTNPEAPWWDLTVNETIELKGRLYASMGSFNAGQMSSMMGVYYNKSLYDSLDIGAVIENKSIYDMVRENQWTFEVMESMTKQLNDNETYGGLVHDLHGIYCSISGSGIKLVEKDLDGNPTIMGLYNDRFISVFEDYYDFFNGNTAVTFFGSEPPMLQKFSEGKTLFMIQSVGYMGKGVLVESGLTYGILPFPMYTTEQGEYRTNTQINEIIHVSANCNNEMACVLLEYLHYQSRKILIPAYFEEKLQYRMADHPDDAEMLQLIRDSLYYDFGTLFTTEINKVWESIRGLIQNKDPNVAGWWGVLQNGQVPQQLLDELLTNYESMS